MKVFGTKEFYSQTEVAKMLGFTRQTIFTKIKKGIIPTEEVLGVKMIPGDYVANVKKEFNFK